MPTTMVNSDRLPSVDLYHHVSIATGSKLIFVSGQVSWDADGITVGEGDLASQIEQAYLNAAAALDAAGATFADVVKLKAYVVDWTPDKMSAFVEGRARAVAQLGVEPVPPSTLIGVVALDTPEHLVELEVTAVLD